MLVIGAGFYIFEAAIHALGLPILEHDKIFLPTHDRYIAIMALTYAALLILVSTNIEKYRTLFAVVMTGIFVSMGNAVLIAHSGGYAAFGVINLDRSLTLIGFGAAVWFVVTLATFRRYTHTNAV